MQTLSKGYKKPQNGDVASVIFPALELNAQLTNDHKHDGVLGEVTQSQAVSLPNGSWVEDPVSSGDYRQDVSLDPNYPVDTTQFSFRTSSGEAVYPKALKQSASSLRVWVNDNTLDLICVYG